MYRFEEIVANLVSHVNDKPEKRAPSFMDLIVFINFIKDEIDLDIIYGEESLTVYFIFENYRVSIMRSHNVGAYKTVKDFCTSVTDLSNEKEKTISSLLIRFVDRRNGLYRGPKPPRYFFEGDHCYYIICFCVMDLFEYMVDSHISSLKSYYTKIQNDGSE